MLRDVSQEDGDNQDYEKAYGNMAYHAWSPWFSFS
jgi:hypothetical protein